MNLLLATNNRGKVEEMRALLSDLPITFHTLGDFPWVETVKETEASYEENASIKARAYAQQTGVLALADDSGLEVKALGGAPGLFSARYAGATASDGDRIACLLNQFEREGIKDRTATFVCVIALADPTNRLVKIALGSCDGQIIDRPQGANGFGYDPIFVPNGFEQTFAELSAEVKNVISHRAKALQSMRDFLQELLSEA
jgi:XTP/dITP diphosphohydrolase